MSWVSMPSVKSIFKIRSLIAKVKSSYRIILIKNMVKEKIFACLNFEEKL